MKDTIEVKFVYEPICGNWYASGHFEGKQIGVWGKWLGDAWANFYLRGNGNEDFSQPAV